MFHIDSNEDESTEKEPCLQAFLVGRGRNSKGQRTYIASSKKITTRMCMYAQFSTRNGHRAEVNQAWTGQKLIFHGGKR